MKNFFCHLIVTLCVVSASFGQVTSGLLAKYSFDSANANDDVGTNHATVYGATLANDRFGTPNSAYHFSGNSIEVDSMDLDTLSKVTMSIWIKPDSIPQAWNNNNTIVTLGGYWALYLNRFTSKAVLGVFDANSTNNSSSDETTPISYSEWSFIVATNDGSTTTVYINGVPEVSFPETFMWGNKSKMIIGEHITSSTQNYNGTLDDFRIYKKVLNQKEIDSLYYYPTLPPCRTFGTLYAVECTPQYLSPSGLHTLTSSGTYQDTLVNSLGCDSFLTVHLTINVIDTTLALVGDTLISNAFGANYQWLNCDANYSIISGAMSQMFTPLTNGNYAVEISKGECLDTSECKLIINTGIEKRNELVSAMYPNPTAGLVELDLHDDRNIKVTVRSFTGQHVATYSFLAHEFKQFTIDAVPGMYFLEVSTDDGKAEVLRIIKK
jgi:hypothetical protein